MTSDINTRVYRRYGWERNRILLYKQDRVAELSEQLKALDRRDDRLQSPGLYSRRDDEEQEPCQRPHLIRRLESELKEYDDILLREHAITSIPNPTRSTHRSIFDWVYNNKPIVRDEYQYLYQQDDFVLLGSQHDRWLWSFEEKIWALGHNRLFRVSMHALSYGVLLRCDYVGTQNTPLKKTVVGAQSINTASREHRHSSGRSRNKTLIQIIH